LICGSLLIKKEDFFKMKKIIGIIAAVAMATSVFAADISAKAKLDGSLFKFDAGAISMIEAEHAIENWNPTLSLATSGDKAGASFSYFVSGWKKNYIPNKTKPASFLADPEKTWEAPVDGSEEWAITDAKGNNYDTTNQQFAIWFAPFDGFKITVGHFSCNLNQESIDWCNTETQVEFDGYMLSYGSNGFTADVLFNAWDGHWFSKPKDGDASIKQVFAKLAYGADFGKIGFEFDFEQKSKMFFGLGYGNTFGSVNMFVNAMGEMCYDWASDSMKFGKIRYEVFASTSIDTIGISAFIAGDVNTDDTVAAGLSYWRLGHNEVGGKTSLGSTLKVTYPLGSVGGYFYFKDNDFMAEKFACEIKPGFTGSCGSMGWEVALDMNINTANEDAFSLNVPVNFSVAW
jgi:hypothetical protein